MGSENARRVAHCRAAIRFSAKSRVRRSICSGNRFSHDRLENENGEVHETDLTVLVL